MASVSAHVTAELPRARGSLRAGWQRLKREPLLHFLALGALIFLVAHAVEQARDAAHRQIVVDDALEQRIIQLQRVQNGTAPSGEQLQRLVQNYVDDEVMYREALRMGLDQDDEIVRRRLIQKVQFLQRDLTVPAVPTEAELHAYFSRHAARFATPATVAFEQVYFSPEQGGWAEAEAAARRTHSQLASGAVDPAQSGDPFPLPIDTHRMTRADVQQLFGATPIVDAVFDTRAGTWSEPVRSGYGWHLVRVLARAESTVPAFENVRNEVRAAHAEDAASRDSRRQLDALRARYQIIRRHENDR